jgi:uncharacterized protein (UPF0332 family)
MNHEDYKVLAKVRFERANELVHEAELLIEDNAYKSANNRAYYAIEKTINGLLALSDITVKTHKGCILQFSELYVKSQHTPFDREDFKSALKAERIRSISDYDDFYIANKAETLQQIHFAKTFLEKAYTFFENL